MQYQTSFSLLYLSKQAHKFSKNARKNRKVDNIHYLRRNSILTVENGDFEKSPFLKVTRRLAQRARRDFDLNDNFLCFKRRNCRRLAYQSAKTKVLPSNENSLSENSLSKECGFLEFFFVGLQQTNAAVFAAVHRFHIARFVVDKQVEIVS